MSNERKSHVLVRDLLLELFVLMPGFAIAYWLLNTDKPSGYSAFLAMIVFIIAQGGWKVLAQRKADREKEAEADRRFSQLHDKVREIREFQKETGFNSSYFKHEWKFAIDVLEGRKEALVAHHEYSLAKSGTLCREVYAPDRVIEIMIRKLCNRVSKVFNIGKDDIVVRVIGKIKNNDRWEYCFSSTKTNAGRTAQEIMERESTAKYLHSRSQSDCDIMITSKKVPGDVPFVGSKTGFREGSLWCRRVCLGDVNSETFEYIVCISTRFSCFCGNEIDDQNSARSILRRLTGHLEPELLSYSLCCGLCSPSS